MNYLLTGATGFLGQNLCNHYTKDLAKLRILSRHARQSLDKFPYNAQFIDWDHVSATISADDLNCDAVIHLAGENIAGKRWTKAQKKKLWESRIKSTTALVESILKAPIKPKVFICASAVGFYGDRWQEDLDETSPAGEGFLAELCAKWESVCEPLESVGVRVINVRSGLVLGLNDGALKELVKFSDLGVLGNIGSGNQWMSWIHVEDWVNAIQHCISNSNISGPVNFVSPSPIQHKNFIKILSSHLNRAPFLPLPATVAKIVLGEMAGLFLDSQKVYPTKLLSSGFTFNFKTFDSALQNLYPNCGQEHILERQMFLPVEVKDVFPFFTDPYNLEKITPPFLNFKVVSTSDKVVQKGTTISYKLKLHGLPLKWLTNIEDLAINSLFIDNQTKGPYKRWHHTHTFISLPHGTLMRDRVLYRLPFGWLGRCIAHFYATKDVNKIFDYRTLVLKKRFSQTKNAEHINL